MSRKRKTHTQDFKDEAVRLVQEGRRGLAQVSRDLGVHEIQLRRWKQNSENANGLGSPHSDFSARSHSRSSKKQLKSLSAKAGKVQIRPLAPMGKNRRGALITEKTLYDQRWSKVLSNSFAIAN
ncbi:transposase [Magnetofaba australis]|uniref:transposase n=1 Tax=Magnetofaba australis TaxID=1472297 RepID=UPI000A19BFBC|nr:transposase [Magnetofaba australis]